MFGSETMLCGCERDVLFDPVVDYIFIEFGH